MRFWTLLFSLLNVALAKKGGKNRIDLTDVVNPDPDAGKYSAPVYNNEMIEGDIVPEEYNPNSEDRNAVNDGDKLWPQGTVPYELDENISSFMKGKIELAIADYTEFTCVKFVPRNGETDYVAITTEDLGCYAKKGRMGGKQPLNLADPNCGEKGTVIHEMMHTIGFAHEQNRNDRDEYVTIHFDNIKKSRHSQYRKLTENEENNQGFGYDYSSAMHYDAYGFAINKRIPVITTKNPRDQNKIGQRAGFSKQDIKEVNRLYKCNGKESGVGGTNGCMDKESEFCAETVALGKERFCRDTIKDYCMKSCGAC